MAKRNVSEIETGAGFFMGFVSATMDVVREKEYPFAAIYRLATACGRTTLGKIVDLAYADWQAEQPKLVKQPQGRGGTKNGNAPFSAPIFYVQPTFEELQRRFPHKYPAYKKGMRFDPIECCKSVPTYVSNREVVFEYFYMVGRTASTDQVLAEMDRGGLRPALYEELLGFGLEYPDEQLRKYPIIALGSVTRVNDRPHVACLWSCDGDRDFRLYPNDNGWLHDHGQSFRFLAVPK